MASLLWTVLLLLISLVFSSLALPHLHRPTRFDPDQLMSDLNQLRGFGNFKPPTLSNFESSIYDELLNDFEQKFQKVPEERQ